MWSVYEAASRIVPIVAVVAWIVFAVASAVVGDRRRIADAVGWAASGLTALVLLPYFSIVVGLLLFLPALWFERAGAPGAVSVVAWAEAVVLTAAVLAMGRWFVRRFGRVRYLAAVVVILGLGSVWMGRYLATVDWFAGPG